MKSRKMIITTIIALAVITVVLFLNVLVKQKFIKTYTYAELEYRGYTAQDISEVKIKHSYLNRILSYNEWRISVEFKKQLAILFYISG